MKEKVNVSTNTFDVKGKFLRKEIQSDDGHSDWVMVEMFNCTPQINITSFLMYLTVNRNNVVLDNVLAASYRETIFDNNVSKLLSKIVVNVKFIQMVENILILNSWRYENLYHLISPKRISSFVKENNNEISEQFDNHDLQNVLRHFKHCSKLIPTESR